MCVPPKRRALSGGGGAVSGGGGGVIKAVPDIFNVSSLARSSVVEPPLNGRAKIATVTRVGGRKQMISWVDAPDDVYFVATDSTKWVLEWWSEGLRDGNDATPPHPPPQKERKEREKEFGCSTVFFGIGFGEFWLF